MIWKLVGNLRNKGNGFWECYNLVGELNNKIVYKYKVRYIKFILCGRFIVKD